MKPTSIIHRLVILLITLMSAIGANAQEAYACYNAEKTTLTFYYDNLRNTRPGTTYDLNTSNDEPGWCYDGTNSYVTKVVFDSSFAGARPTTTYDWFYGMTNLEFFEGMRYLNTSEVTNMAGMFADCSKLTSLYLNHFNTSKVTKMLSMFSNCSRLTSLDLSSFNTSKVTVMNFMFYDCNKLRTIYVGNRWSTDAVTAAQTVSAKMFSFCTNLVGGQGTTYDVSHIDHTYAHIDGGPSDPGYFTGPPEAYACYTSSNTTLTFYYDNLRSSHTNTYSLNTGTVEPGWLSANVTEVVFDSSFAGARPKSTFSWFSGMANLESIEGMSYLNTSEVTDMRWMFYNCSKLTSLDLSHFDTSDVDYMARMFSGCSNLTILDLSSFNTSLVDDMSNMFYECRNLQTICVGSGWNVDGVLSSGGMFMRCTSLVGGQGTVYNYTHADKTYAHIDGGTSNPGYLSTPPEAYACYTSSNATLTFYFDNHRSNREGTTYDLNTGGISPVWMTNGTYDNVTKVVFDPSLAGVRLATTFGWLYRMTKLKTIEGMSYLNTSEVTNMAWMFYCCSGLTSLDLSNFNTSKVAQMDYMFGECSNLQTIYVGDGWSTAAVTESDLMFDGCTKLVGGQGTTYNANHVDKTYARIDGGTSNPGYFTYKKPSGIATDLHQVTSDKSQVTSDDWYTIDGRKLNGMPAKKGVYIQNGQKRIIK